MKSRLRQSLRWGVPLAWNALITGKPFLLYLKPTPRCNLRCECCNRWQSDDDPTDEIGLDEIRALLEKFRRAGCSVLTLWGGEPTLRSDLGDILRIAQGLGYRTAMCTNGYLLPRRADQILPHLDDVLLCSLDGYGATHDELRATEGLFDAVVKSLELSRDHPGCHAKIWASIQRNTVDQVDELVHLAARLDVSIELFPISPIAGYNDELVPLPEHLEAAFARAIELKGQGLPITNPDYALEIMRTGAAFRCNFPTIAISVDHRGEVHTCENPAGERLHRWGHHDRFDPQATFRSAEYRRAVASLKDCNQCRLPCMVELSGSIMRGLGSAFLSRRVWRDWLP
ncbi:MAG: radical SAM protein [Deltaproteobacteria bacterium]|nr:radical SAM protein [Deltaproteobacteria bacterium]